MKSKDSMKNEVILDLFNRVMISNEDKLTLSRFKEIKDYLEIIRILFLSESGFIPRLLDELSDVDIKFVQLICIDTLKKLSNFKVLQSQTNKYIEENEYRHKIIEKLLKLSKSLSTDKNDPVFNRINLILDIIKQKKNKDKISGKFDTNICPGCGYKNTGNSLSCNLCGIILKKADKRDFAKKEQNTNVYPYATGRYGYSEEPEFETQESVEAQRRNEELEFIKAHLPEEKISEKTVEKDEKIDLFDTVSQKDEPIVEEKSNVPDLNLDFLENDDLQEDGGTDLFDIVKKEAKSIVEKKSNVPDLDLDFLDMDELEEDDGVDLLEIVKKEDKSIVDKADTDFAFLQDDDLKEDEDLEDLLSIASDAEKEFTDREEPNFKNEDINLVEDKNYDFGFEF